LEQAEQLENLVPFVLLTIFSCDSEELAELEAVQVSV
jgi:hypothetical protein